MYTRIGEYAIVRDSTAIRIPPSKGTNVVLLQSRGCEGPFRIPTYKEIWKRRQIQKSDIMGLPRWCELEPGDTLHRENGLRFVVNVRLVYFNPRYAEERKRISNLISGDKLLVLYGGIAPFPCTLSANFDSICSVDWNPHCTKYATMNARLNKLNNIRIVESDVVKHVAKLREKYSHCLIMHPSGDDHILMALRGRIDTIVHYKLLQVEDLEFYTQTYSRYFQILGAKLVKKYCKTHGIYRFILQNPQKPRQEISSRDRAGII